MVGAHAEHVMTADRTGSSRLIASSASTELVALGGRVWRSWLDAALQHLEAGSYLQASRCADAMREVSHGGSLGLAVIPVLPG